MSPHQEVGADRVGVQIDGSDNTVTLIVRKTKLVLDQRHLVKARPTNEPLLTELQGTDLVGRGGDLANLQPASRRGRLQSEFQLIARGRGRANQ